MSKRKSPKMRYLQTATHAPSGTGEFNAFLVGDSERSSYVWFGMGTRATGYCSLRALRSFIRQVDRHIKTNPRRRKPR